LGTEELLGITHRQTRYWKALQLTTTGMWSSWITKLTHNSFSCMFISILYIFRAATWLSSGELIVSIRHQVYVTLYRWPFSVQVWMSLIQTFTLNGHLYRVTYTSCRIDTIISPDDGHVAAQNV
jgi:hypothetical protein